VGLFYSLKMINLINSKIFFTCVAGGVCFIINCGLIYLVEKKNFKEVFNSATQNK